MSQVKLGAKNIPFIYQGDELLYPNPIKDGLVLWYDFKGVTNNNKWKQYPRDLSGNNRKGNLYNSAYTSDSGYNNGLKFDGVDDFLTIGQPCEFKTVEIALQFSSSTVTANKIFLSGTDPLDYIYFDTGANLIMRNRRKSSGTFQLKTLPNNTEKDFSKIKHLIIKQDNFKFSAYINGVLVGEAAYPEEAIPFYLMNIFNFNQNKVINDTLKSIKVYDRGLTEKEIQQNYQLEKERWGL